MGPLGGNRRKGDSCTIGDWRLWKFAKEEGAWAVIAATDPPVGADLGSDYCQLLQSYIA